MSAKGFVGFVCGSVFGAACGFAAGILLAPRPGAESRAMAADALNDAWDSAVDSYERGTRAVNEKINQAYPNFGVTSEDLKAKVDLARQKMDQLRSSLSQAVSNASAQIKDAVDTVSDQVSHAVDEAQEAAQGVHVEIVEDGEQSE